MQTGRHLTDLTLFISDDEELLQLYVCKEETVTRPYSVCGRAVVAAAIRTTAASTDVAMSSG